MKNEQGVLIMRNERGVALVITLFLMAALSALAVSLVFLSQTETSASRNYKSMSQARYAAEAGVHRAINYVILDTFKASMTANLASFDLTQSPVKYNSNDVVLSASGGSSNYPDATAASTFANSVKGTLAVGTGYAAYSASATLLSMRTVDVYGTAPDIIMTWRITGRGTVCKGTSACATSDTDTLGTLDVTATLERDLNNAETYAVFATAQTCGALTIGGNASTDSYNSQTMTSTPPSGSDISDTGGNVGTNGNLFVGNNAAANMGGSLYTPRTGAGNCSSGNPNAVSGPGSATVAGGMVPMGQTVAYPSPTIPSPIPTTNITLAASDGTAGCNTKLASAGVIGWSCTVTGPSLLLVPVSSTTLTLGNVTIGSNTNLTVAGGGPVTMNVNSFLLGSNATMTMTSGPNTTITMNIAGQSLGGSTKPLDLSGGGTVNSTYDSTRFQILYAGTAEMDVVGNNTAAVTIYAPNAAVKTTGSGNVYGSILSNTFTDLGGAHLHYDSSLQKKYQTLGNYAMSSFSWRKY